MTERTAEASIPEEDQLRSHWYGFLGQFLISPPDSGTLKLASALKADDGPFGQSVSVLARVAGKTSSAAAEREFNRLFIGVGRGELVPYASYYMTGFLNEKPLAILRQDLAQLGIERSPGVFEPEDHIGTLCEVMAGLIGGAFGSPASLGRQKEFFDRHLRPWARHFFTDLEAAESSVLYAPVGSLGRMFIEIETEAFRMAGENAA